MRTSFYCVCLMFISMLALAQTDAVILTSQNQPVVAPTVFRSQRSFPSGQRRTGEFKRAARQRDASQMLGLNFANAVDYGSGGENAVLIAVADVNGDGKPDLVVANSCPANSTTCPSPTDEGSVGVLLGNGDGTFRPTVVYDSGGVLATWVAVADVNGDGKPDLLVTHVCANSSSCANGTVSVLLGNGDGTFRAAVAYDSGGIEADSVAVADMNGDGKPDLVVSNCTNCSTDGHGSVAVLLSNGDGTFQTAHAIDSGGYAPLSIALADVNGDGKPDVIVGQCSGPTFGCRPGEVGVLLGNGDGTLQTPVNYSSGADQPISVAVADVNGDGKLDVVVSNQATGDQGTLNGAVGVLLGNGDGTFQPPVIYDAGGIGTAGLAVADVNGDGKLDVVVTDQLGSCQTASTVAVLLGNGEGTFQAAVGFCFAGSIPRSVVAADVNGDGRPDLVATNSCGTICGISVVGVLLNTSTTAILSPSSLNFAPQAPGTSSSPQTVTLTNRGIAALTFSGITISGANAAGFTETNNCPSSLAVNASCQIKVTSNPEGAGSQTASLNVTDNAPDSPQTVALTGISQDFSLAITPGTTTVTPGQAGNYTVTASPLSGFSQAVALTCSGAPPQSTCNISPSSVTLNGSSDATANIAVVTSGRSAGLNYPGGASPSGVLAIWLAPLSLGLVVLGRHAGRRRRGSLRVLALICLFAVGAGTLSCGRAGSGGGSGTPTGTYVVSVTGTFTSGEVNLTHIAKTTLVVQ
jgi:uncharacterized protein (DUF2141 family)